MEQRIICFFRSGVLLILLSSVVFVSCSKQSKPQPEIPEKPVQTNETGKASSVVSADKEIPEDKVQPEPVNLLPMDNRQDIINKLGKSSSIKYEMIENPHQPEIKDRFYHYYYNGVVVEMYYSEAVGRDFVQRIYIDQEVPYFLKYPVYIGDSEQNVQEIIGREPDMVHEDQWIYQIIILDVHEEDLIIHFNANRKVRLIEWNLIMH